MERKDWIAVVLHWSAVRAFAFALFLGLGAQALPAAAQFRFDDYQLVEPPPQLRAAIARWNEAMDTGDAARIAAEYDPQGWLKLPCSPAGFRQAEIALRWREALSLSPASLSLNPSSFELSRSGDMATERGWAQLMQNVGGLPYATNVDYLRVWRRSQRTWLIVADVFAPGGPCAVTNE